MSPTPALIVIRKKKKNKEWEAVANCLRMGILQEANGTQMGDTRDTFLKKAKTNNAAPGRSVCSARPRICTQSRGDVRARGFDDQSDNSDCQGAGEGERIPELRFQPHRGTRGLAGATEPGQLISWPIQLRLHTGHAEGG